MQNVIVVILSVCYVDYLLCHNFLGLNPSAFSAKSKRKLAKKKKAEQKVAYAKVYQITITKKEKEIMILQG